MIPTRQFHPERLQGRLVILVVLCVLPAMALTFWTARDERRIRAEQQQTHALQLARAASLTNERLIEGSHQLLVALAQLESVRSPALSACDRTLGEILAAQRPYANLGVAAPDGRVVCSAVPFDGVVNVTDRAYFSRAVISRSFAVGDYQIGRITQTPSLAVALPMTEGERIVGVVFASIDVGRLNTLANSSDLPPGSSVVLLDAAGTVLNRFPEGERYIGRSLPEAPLAREVLAKRDGTTDVTGLDGQRRLYGFTQLEGVPSPGAVYVAIGLPRGSVLDPVNRLLARNVLALATVGIAALALAMSLGRRFLIRPVQQAFRREQEATEALKEADEMKNAFLAAVSHDLRSPVAAVRGFADVLAGRLGTLPSEDVPKLADRIGANARRIDRLLTGLLDVDRLSKGVVEPVRRPTNVCSVAEEIVEDLELGPKVRINVPRLIASVDPVQLERIVENLVTNAVRHTPRGTLIELSVERVPEGIIVRADDEGPGVPDEHKLSIFEAFNRGGAGAYSPGLGVGLHLVSRFAELHGGRAWVEDNPTGGASFRVLLPCAVEDSPEIPVVELDDAEPARTSSGDLA